MSDVLLFNLFRRKKREWSREAMAALTQAEVDEINAVLADWKRSAAQEARTAPPASSGMSVGPEGVSSLSGHPGGPQGQSEP